MPEGPELHLASKFVNTCCNGRVFGGKIVKNPVHKSSDVAFDSPAYSIAATSRGKEMQLILTKLDTSPAPKNVNVGKTKKSKTKGKACDTDSKVGLKPETHTILFRFGMSGNFQFTTAKDIHKHSHLRFFTQDDEEPMVLSFVDVRRFGRWEVDADWSKDRGPDPMFEYQAFRSKVVKNLKNSAFNQPICEVMLNQKYFNGIGNYLRAEILYRLGIPPFEQARTVLEGLSEEPPDVKPVKGGPGRGKKGEEPDLLHLCHTVPLEVIAIGAGGYTADGKASDYSDFMQWLQCYYQDGMSNMVDHNKRTIWFTGPPGPMVPKEGKSRSPNKRKQTKGSGDEEVPVKVKKEEVDNQSEKGSKKTSRRKPVAKSPQVTPAKVTSPKKRATSKRKGAGSSGAKEKEEKNIKSEKVTPPEEKATSKRKATGNGGDGEEQKKGEIVTLSKKRAKEKEEKNIKSEKVTPPEEKATSKRKATGNGGDGEEQKKGEIVTLSKKKVTSKGKVTDNGGDGDEQKKSEIVTLSKKRATSKREVAGKDGAGDTQKKTGTSTGIKAEDRTLPEGGSKRPVRSRRGVVNGHAPLDRLKEERPRHMEVGGSPSSVSRLRRGARKK